MAAAQPHEFIAVLPAAGHGTRLGLNRSKELVPIRPSHDWPAGRPVIDYLLERLALAGVLRAKIVVRVDKTDLAAALGAERHGMQLEYVETGPTASAVHTIAVALRSAPSEQPWILGYPDILLQPRLALRQLIEEPGFDANQEAVRLALFPSDRPEKTDMVELDDRGRVVSLRIKQPDAGLRLTWSSCCWGEGFSRLLLEATNHSIEGSELFVGNVVNQALRGGCLVGASVSEHGRALDVGTPDDLERARATGVFD